MKQRQAHVCLPVGSLEDLDGPYLEVLQQALTVCPACRRRYEAYKAQQALLGSWVDGVASPDLWASVRGRLEKPRRAGPRHLGS